MDIAKTVVVGFLQLRRMKMLVALLADTGVAPIFGGMFVVILLLAIAASIFWLWMLIDAVMNEQGTDKIVWFLVIFFLHLLGALIYFFVRRSGRGVRAA
ncbi:MAG TPA: PLDc N-terminal domain-containing protein [Phycisphaerae bacterium]|jgi:hypothetical protein|nr:PLDc N-terminal domain-containing protein [Phycisphaerae bacterium]